MSDLLTHWAVFDDCRRLAAGDPGIDSALQEMLQAQREYARLGAITRGGNQFMPQLLRGLRDRRQGDGDADARVAQKVAFVLGCLTHQACDNAMKPLLSRGAGDNWSRAHIDVWDDVPGARERFAPHNEISAYYDTYVFKQVYLNGAEEPFSPSFLADVAGAPEAALEEFVRSLFQRALLASHTLNPDLSAPERWLDEIFSRYQALYVDIATYVRVFAHPDLAKMEELGVETEFYRADDPIIEAARAVQATGAIPGEISRAQFAQAHNRSFYARAVALGLEYIRNGSALWRGETDELVTPNSEGDVAPNRVA